MDMNKFLIATAVLILLAACGGGGSSGTNSSPASVGTSAPPPGNATAPTPQDQVVSAPVAPGSALNLTAKSYIEGSSGQTTVVKFTGAANLTLSGQLANIWVSAAETGGSVTISGKLNTVVFLPGTDTTVTVTDSASGNTLYLPVGSQIKVTGAGAAATTLRYYK
jgi:hypothetical protein